MRILALTLGCTAMAFGAWAAEPPAASGEPTEPKPLEVGDEAPDFELPKKDGEEEPQRLKDLRGKKNVLIAFYPKAFTSGCTKQLCGYRDDFSQFEAADTEVVAVSIDEQAESDRFKAEEKMPFLVKGDPTHEVIEAYRVPYVEFGGNRYAKRCVFLVDKEGTVRYIDMDYNITDDKTPLYEQIAKLNEQAVAAG